jgi:hypothetical protein
MVGVRNTYKVIVGQPEGKRDYMGDLCFDERIILKMDPREIHYDGVNWTDLPQDRNHWRALVNKEPLSSMKVGVFLDEVSECWLL